VDAYDSIISIIQDANVASRGHSISSRKKKDPRRPAAAWVTSALIGAGKGTAISIVLGTIGCSHAQSESGGCTMCSYLLDGNREKPKADDLVQQFSSAMERVASSPAPLSVKLYTSGSFLDPDEVQEEARGRIFSLISDDLRVEEVVIESRPEFATPEVLEKVRAALGSRRVELGIGLESSADLVRSICINKGFDLLAFKTALDTAANYGIGVRSYVLLKPPFLTERDAMEDAIRTIEDAGKIGVSTVSLNPVNVQKNTMVERLWERGNYRPPWLWSLVEVLTRGRALLDRQINLLCDPVAAGKSRGVHNCGQCDAKVVEAVRAFSISQHTAVFDGLDCSCRRTWEHTLSHEDISLNVHNDWT
jgi:radical SAM enzyme (TIGR01210 family)